MLAPTLGLGNLAVLAVESEDILLARAATGIEIDGVRYVLTGLAGHLPLHSREGRVHRLKRVLRCSTHGCDGGGLPLFPCY